ncbi:furin isoform X1 [Corvus cornix cornix]|uniref:furin isoform X1 n=1 Tax=Corvus brachyrhynchos TaxID=85066 RepID=UPI0008165D8F|nr:PREDICTED: furin isoform X1 [Corvus brachyrhynchos]XP_019136511.2 furin isoform X1 [Corvus cornix cornix]
MALHRCCQHESGSEQISGERTCPARAAAMHRGLREWHVPPDWICDETPLSGDGAEVPSACSWQCFPSCCGARSGLAARAKGHWFCGIVSTVQGHVLQLGAQACHEFHPCEPQRLCASSALVFSPHCGSVAGGWHLFSALCHLAAVSLPLQAEPHVLQQPRLWKEFLVWACFLLFWSPSQCLCCGTGFGWSGLCRVVMAVQWEECGWKEPGFPSQVSGLLLLGIFGDYYHFRHRGVVKRSLSPHQPWHSRLAREPQVQWLEQQVAKRRTKRDVFMEPTDPKFPQQWYLYNTNQRDLNVRQAWEQGYTGKGIVVSILDDGIEKNHPDLEANYDPGASFDVNDQDPDPQPRYTQMNDNRHGTRCAGEVAAVANNGICGVGVAYNARIGGVRMLDGEVTDAVEAHSLGLNPNHIHIYSASWGPEDDGKTVDGPARLAEEAFFRGVSQGRGGLGSIFVWASGNGGREHDSCNCDGYTNSIYTLSISSTTQYGNVPWYSEACSSTLATTYSSGNQNEKQIVTTDLRQKCTELHTGTSASAPLAAGIIALALEANKNLTWRDMQHLVVQTSKPAHLNANDWVTNGVGRKVSHSYGYGLLDAGAMVSLAKNWTTVGPQRKCVIDILAEPRDIGKRLEVRRKVDACLGKANYISRLEHAQARLTLSYNRRGDLAIHLVSPMGTRSTLLAARPHDFSADGFNDWAFMTTHSWDEDPSGEWVLEIENTSDANNYGTLTKFTLVLYGTATDSPSLSNQLESSGCKTLTPSQTCVVCEEGYYLHQKSCLKRCPPGFAPGVQSTHYNLENSVEPIAPHLCLPCHPSCATCAGPGPNQCLTCPAHSHFSSLDLSCSHQTQSSRASPALADGEGPAEAPPPVNLPVLIASLSCILIVIIFVTIFLVLQARSGFSLRGVKVYALDSGIISYKGLPSDIWQEEGPSESDGEDYEAHSERTAFIRDQSAL